MTETDPVAAFKRHVAGKQITFHLEAGPVSTLDGEPIRVDDATTTMFTFDEDGDCVPVWDEPTEEGEHDDRAR